MRTDGRTDRQADMTKLIVTFRYFANAPTKTSHLMLHGEIIAVCSEVQYTQNS